MEKSGEPVSLVFASLSEFTSKLPLSVKWDVDYYFFFLRKARATFASNCFWKDSMGSLT